MITKDILRTIYLRGENIDKDSRIDVILVECLRSAINGFDFNTYRYDETNIEEVREMESLAEKLKLRGFNVHFDGDTGHMYMSVSWFYK